MPLIRSIHAAITLLLLAFAVGFYTDHQTALLHQQSTRIQLGLERMLRLNQGLTYLMNTAVLEQNSLRAASYPSLLAELDATLQDVLQQTHGMKLAGDMRQLQQDHQTLRADESTVFDLMRQDRWPEALQHLQVSNYAMTLKLYEINSEAAVGALSIELTQATQAQQQWRNLTLLLRLVALLLLLWTGWRYSQRLQAELAQQTQLRTALAQANAELEDKVQQRTHDLETANRQLERLSITDALTLLANRRHFDAVLAKEWQRAQRSGTPLGLILLDIDHFKAYNDHYGHPQGDECLRQVGAVLRTTIRRAGDLVARYGGEEFVVIVPGSETSQTLALAEKIRSNLQAAAILHGQSSVGPVVTCSLGVAQHTPGLRDTPSALLQAADAALYAAKQQGRNRVVLGQSLTESNF